MVPLYQVLLIFISKIKTFILLQLTADPTHFDDYNLSFIHNMPANVTSQLRIIYVLHPDIDISNFQLEVKSSQH